MTGVIQRNGRTVRFIAHKAILSGKHRGNTIGAVCECLDAGVPRLEIDIHSLDGADFAVFHERRLEHETDGRGSIGRVTPEDIRAVHFLQDPADRPPLLSEVVEAARGCDTQLQLDLKDWRPMVDDRIRVLLDVIAPVHDQVIVSTGQDWNLRRLNRADPDLALGFDPGHYIDHAIEGADVFLPRAMGAYGYRDDHPMAFGKTETTLEYLTERWNLVLQQQRWAKEYFLSYLLVLQMLDDGYDVIAFLHEQGIGVTAWTPDYRGPDSLRILDRLAAAGVDRITTNTTNAWEVALTDPG
jgi:glycerophosphoryl diester phosphodiesterase